MSREGPDDIRPAERELLEAIRQRLPELDALLERSDSHWGREDLVYRFYHQSWKVYGVQALTSEIVSVLRSLSHRPLNELFLRIVEEGTGRKFSTDDNANWASATRPLLEAFFHARYFLEMIVRYGRELEEPPTILPSGWAAVLELYGLR